MPTFSLKNFPATRWFYLFIILHVVCWTLVPILVRYNLPLDSIEGTIWGHQLELGYDKNPFMNGWLTALAVHLGGDSGWMIYLFSQLSVLICFWCVFQIAKTMLSPIYALMAVMLLEGVQYFNFHSIDFNDNTLELSLWGLTIYFFYQALTKNKNTLAWLLTGVFAALGMMAKYYTAALLAGMFLFLLLNKKNREQFKHCALYLSASVFLIIILPHTIWLFFHDFVTVTYVFERTNSEPSWTNHLFFPAQFAWQQFEVFLPVLLLYGLLFIGKKPRLDQEIEPLSSFNKQFLFYVVLGPFLLTLLLAILFGIKLRAGWGAPLQSFWPIILIAALPVNLSRRKIYVFITTIFLLLALSLTGYAVSLMKSKDASSANFPGQEIAATITKQWHDTYQTKLNYVAGSRWIGGNIEFYSADHPSVYIEWSKRRSPWIDEAALRKNGAVFVWDISSDESLPADIRTKFPSITQPIVMEFSYQRNYYNLPPVKVGVAFLPPEKP